MRIIMALLPPNLAHQLVDDTLPWDQSTKFHVDSFLENYTLHDSYWITLQTNCGWENSMVAAISFDSVWNQSVAAPTARCAEWPILFLRFSLVKSLQLSGFSEIGGLQRGISSVSVEHHSEEEVTTKIGDHYGAAIEIRHWPLIDALVFDSDQSIVKLPSPVS